MKKQDNRNGNIKGFILLPTLRLPMFIIAALALLAGGFWRENAGLYAASAFVLICPVISLVYSLLVLPGLSGLFYYSESKTTKDQNDPLILKINNRSIMPIFSGSAMLTIPAENMEYEVSENVKVFFACMPLSSAVRYHDISFKYSGKFTATVNNVAVFDPLGMFRCVSKKDVDADVTVLPLGTKPNVTTLGYAAESSSNSKPDNGKGNEEFYDIREYIPGDSLRDIHWKLSAKNNELIVIRRTSHDESKHIIICDGGTYSKSPSEIKERDIVFETVKWLISEDSENDIKLVTSNGSYTVTCASDADEAITFAICAPRHKPGAFTIRDDITSDCAGLTIVTAMITDDIIKLASTFRIGSSPRIPINIILCSSLQSKVPKKRLGALNIGLVRVTGGAS